LFRSFNCQFHTLDPKDRRTFILILYVLKELSHIDQTES